MHQSIDPLPDYAAMVRALLAGGQTTHSLARLLGISQPSVSRLATGRTRELGGDVAVRLIRLAGGSVVLPQDHVLAPAAPAVAAQDARDAA